MIYKPKLFWEWLRLKGCLGVGEYWGVWLTQATLFHQQAGALPVKNSADKTFIFFLSFFSQFCNFVGFTLVYLFCKMPPEYLRLLWKWYQRQQNILWESLLVWEELTLENGVRVVSGTDNAKCKTAVEEIWRGYSAAQIMERSRIPSLLPCPVSHLCTGSHTQCWVSACPCRTPATACINFI